MSCLIPLISWRRPRAGIFALIATASALSPRLAAATARPKPFLSPTVTITPGTSTFSGTTPTYTVSVTVKFCSTTSANLDASTRSFTLDGVALDNASFSTTSGVGTGCTFSLGYTGSVVLPQTNDGVHLFQASIEDVNGFAGFKNATYTYRWPGWVPPSYAVRVMPLAHTKDVATGGGQTAAFTVMNIGSRSSNYALSWHCARAASCTSVSPATASLDTLNRTVTATVNFTAGSVGDTGSVMLVARNTGSGLAGDADSAATDIMIPSAIPNNAPGVVIAGAGDVVSRELCLTIAAGGDAAYECGDLRLAQALPGVVTRGKARVPILLYNSAHAVGNALVAADVTPVTTKGSLDSLVATVKVGAAQFGRGKWSGWPTGMTRRIGVKIDSLHTTGIYSYQLTLLYYWAGNGTSADTISGQLPIVNRNTSPFGAGWWLAGLEQVQAVSGDLFWVGGDGSTQLYRASGANKWRATNGLRPDSIYWTGSVYVRTLPSGATVEFNGAGQHTATRPAVGPATYFGYTGGTLADPLQQITLPSGYPDGDTHFRYTFSYYADSVVVQLITPTLTRKATVVKSGGKIAATRDPDGTLVQFGYVSGTPYVNARTDRNGHATAYTYDAAWHLGGFSRAITGGSVGETFVAAESRGVNGTTVGQPQSPDSTYTLVDGPRSDVADITRVWLSKYGSPARMKNAYGRETRILFDPTWAALPSEVRAPGGAIAKAWYNSRGLADSTKVWNLRASGDVGAATRYVWDSTLAAPVQVTRADGSISSYAYNRDGTVAFAQVGADTMTRVRPQYWGSGTPGVGLYRSSNLPGRAERDSVIYDSVLANATATEDRKGHWSYTSYDGLGRQTLERSEFRAGFWRRDSTHYDAAGRVDSTRTWADAVTYYPLSQPYVDTMPADTVLVASSYDNEGNVLEVDRWVRPNPAGIGVISDNYQYDEANRKTSEFNSAGTHLFFTYDPAGNVTLKRSNLTSVQTDFDEANLPTRQIVSSRVYAGQYCTPFFTPYHFQSLDLAPCNFWFPLTTSGATLTIPGDTAFFAYDAAGNTLRADNKSARIRRTYSPGGLLLTDSSFVRTLRYATEGSTVPGNDFTTHPYGIRYAYDAAGRLDSLWHPDVLDPCSGACPAQRFVFDTLTGRLASVVDVLGRVFGFSYNVAGQLTAIGYPGADTATTQYDANGGIVRHTIGSSTFKFIDDSITLDTQGRPTESHGYVVRDHSALSIYNGYSGLGSLAETETYPGNATSKLEEFKHDALGNEYWTRRSHVKLAGGADEPQIRNSYFDPSSGRLTRRMSPDSVTGEDNEMFKHYFDAEGRTQYVSGWTGSAESQEAHYYDGYGRLVLFERHIGSLQQSSLGNSPSAIQEWYRYDAVGRRVLVNTIHEPSCSSMVGCETTVQRFVWAGDQLLYETRARASASLYSADVESDSPSGNGEYGAPKAYGRVGYTHAGGVDRPLGLLRMDGTTLLAALYPHVNWRGLYETATTDTVAASNQTSYRDQIKWPGALASAYLGATVKSDSVFMWFGSLITEQSDASGLLYRRNRYYDPASGRFTQPDPAGIGGGLNSYGFAAGDPVNYGDAFGLCPQAITDPNECAQWDAAERAASEAGKAAARAASARQAGSALVLVGEAAEVIPGAGWIGGTALAATGEATIGAALLYEVTAAKPATKAEIYRQARKKGAPVHHIATNKNETGWTPALAGIMNRAGIGFNDPANLAIVPGHHGPHGAEYHTLVYGALLAATEGLSGAAYTAAVRATLIDIGVAASTPGTPVNLMLTGGH